MENMVNVSLTKELTIHKQNAPKPHKLFISHSSKDKPYMVALTKMLEKIGMPNGSFVCTCVPGYGIPGGAKIFDWLRDQFLTCDLRVLFALSHNYYNSAACLNEMGAGWVTKSNETLLLLPGFNSSDIQGCIDPREIGISFSMEDDELKHRLNEFKDVLVMEHQLSPITQTNWERTRDEFVREVREIDQFRNLNQDGVVRTDKKTNEFKKWNQNKIVSTAKEKDEFKHEGPSNGIEESRISIL